MVVQQVKDACGDDDDDEDVEDVDDDVLACARMSLTLLVGLPDGTGNRAAELTCNTEADLRRPLLPSLLFNLPEN